MRARRSRRLVRRQLPVLEEPPWAGFLIAPTPPADADHFVEGLPLGKCVIGRVNRHHSAAVLHITFKGGLQIRGPIGTIVVQNNYPIFAEIGMKAGEVAVRRGRGNYLHLKQPGLFQFFLVPE